VAVERVERVERQGPVGGSAPARGGWRGVATSCARSIYSQDGINDNKT
jgi:hypothetical protein